MMLGPLVFDGGRAVKRIGSSRVESASQKSYPPSPGARSKIAKTTMQDCKDDNSEDPPASIDGACERSSWSLGNGGAAARRDKTLAFNDMSFSVAGGLLILSR